MALALMLALPMAFAHSPKTALPVPEGAPAKAQVKVLYLITEPKGFPKDTGTADQLLGYSELEFGHTLHDPLRVRKQNQCPPNEVCDTVTIVRGVNSISIQFACRTKFDIKEIHIDNINNDDRIKQIALSLAYQVGKHDKIPHNPNKPTP